MILQITIIALTIGISLEILLIGDIKKCQEAEKIMYSLKKQQEEENGKNTGGFRRKMTKDEADKLKEEIRKLEEERKIDKEGDIKSEIEKELLIKRKQLNDLYKIRK